MRVAWPEYFLGIAQQVATRATCDRAHVGAVIVRDNRIVACGYNGAPSGYPHCDEVGHLMVGGHCLRSIHAEANAIDQARQIGIDLRGCEMFVTHCPCVTCAADIVRWQVRKVWFLTGSYTNDESLSILSQGGVQYEQH